MTDYDPRIVDLYDLDNPDGPDHDFYRSLADEVGAGAVLDLGCGTGILTVTFARGGRRVVGVDPSAAMIAYARRRAGAEGVEWFHGDSRAIPPGPFDVAVMTGNVAQHVPESDWARTLGDLCRALRRGGLLAFESRNPAVRAWNDWTAPPSTRESAHGPLREWSDAREIAPGLVELSSHNVFERTGDAVDEVQLLAFRTRDDIARALTAAGFAVEAVYGGWHREPLAPDSRPMVFVARADPS